MSRLFLALVWPLLLTLLAASPASAADRFHEDLLRDGIAAADVGDAARATKLLRVACFGLLEEPAVLGRCLVRLALAQAGVDQRESFNSTVERLLTVENRFAGYTRAKLDGAVRQRFEAQLRDWTQPEILARSPTFRALAEPEQADPPSSEEAPPAPPASPTPPTAPIESESETDPSPEITAALKAANEAQRSGTRDGLNRELERLRRLIEQYPEESDLQHMAASLAYRLGLWRESQTFFEAGGEIDTDQPVLLFYHAVALYETGDFDRAAEVLKRGLPTLPRNAFIDGYVEKILGSQDR